MAAAVLVIKSAAALKSHLADKVPVLTASKYGTDISGSVILFRFSELQDLEMFEGRNATK